MSTEPTIRAAIKTAIQAVSNVGLVYDYQRITTEWDNFLDLFKTTISGSEVIRGWCITMEGMPVDRETYGLSGSHFERTYNYKVRGYFGVDDSAESEKTALAIAIAVEAALIPPLVSGEPLIYVPSLDVFEYRIFGGVLCHFAEIGLPIIDDYVV